MNPSQEERMLIVDDSEINRAILANLFQAEYRICEAENGHLAWEEILQHKEELAAVLLDVVMPKLNGIEVLRHMHQAGLTGRIPVFLITADAGDAVMKEAYSLGVMDVISKPVIPFVVHRRVNSVVELFRARRRLGMQVEQQRDQLLVQAQQLARASMGMVEALAAAIEFRSDESGEHVRRIRNITEHLLRNSELGAPFTAEEIRLIGVGAITHDVGKISIPDAILHKKGRLTPEEFEVIKTHTVKGAELLAQIPQMRQLPAYHYAYDIALHHHERWDGRGYPDGLVGDQIPIWTQVVSLADVYDALVSKRCYKDAVCTQEAVRMILDGECGAFNPKLLEAFRREEPALRRFYTITKGMQTYDNRNCPGVGIRRDSVAGGPGTFSEQ